MCSGSSLRSHWLVHHHVFKGAVNLEAVALMASHPELFGEKIQESIRMCEASLLSASEDDFTIRLAMVFD